MRERPKTFQFCNFQCVGTVIVRRSVRNVMGAQSARSRHTHNANSSQRPSGSFHQVGSAGQVLYKRPGTRGTQMNLANVKICALNKSDVVSVARHCQSLVGQRSCETDRCAGNVGADWAFSVMVSGRKSGVVSCAIFCVGCPPPASLWTDAPGSPRAASLPPPIRARHP